MVLLALVCCELLTVAVVIMEAQLREQAEAVSVAANVTCVSSHTIVLMRF